MGNLLVLLSAVCFGAMAVFAKLAYAEGVTADALVLVRFWLAAVLLAALTWAWGGRRRRGPAEATGRHGLTRRTVAAALGLGALGYATQATLYFSALERAGAGVVALVFYTYPALVVLAALALGRERPTPARVAALVVATAGTVLVLLGSGPLGLGGAGLAGVALALGAAVTYTGYILVADATVREVPPLGLATLVMVGAAVALSVRGLLVGVDLTLSPAGLAWVACIAVVSTVVAVTAFFAGLRRTGPGTASILSTAEPVATVVLAAAVLGELLAPVQLAGGLLVLASALLVQWRRRGTAPERHLRKVGSRTVWGRNARVPDDTCVDPCHADGGKRPWTSSDSSSQASSSACSASSSPPATRTTSRSG